MIGIRREDKNQWERRAPLTPDHVAELVQEHGLRIVVQPSPLRVFPQKDYATAGAQISEDLSSCRVILGVKEIPPPKILPAKTYAFFAHVTKGQRWNMPMLARLVELGCTLLDYEEIRDGRGRRLVAFGSHAGYAGMLDGLWALGQRLQLEGHTTPLADVRRALHYSGLDEATQHVSRIGELVRHQGLPPELRPIVVGFTGSGNVSRAAQEIFDRLPTQELLAEELPALAADADRPRNVLYKVVFRRADRYERAEGGGFDAAELDAHPERYRGALEPWLPHLTMLVHGAFWRPGQPRIVTREAIRRLWRSEPQPKLRVIADISCDVEGAIEITVRTTTPGDPVYVYEPETGRIRMGLEGRGPVVLAVDNLPCELPVEASQHFGDALLRFLPSLARCPWERALEELGLPPPLARAILVHRGRITPAYAFLQRHLDESTREGRVR